MSHSLREQVITISHLNGEGNAKTFVDMEIEIAKCFCQALGYTANSTDYGYTELTRITKNGNSYTFRVPLDSDGIGEVNIYDNNSVINVDLIADNKLLISATFDQYVFESFDNNHDLLFKYHISADENVKYFYIEPTEVENNNYSSCCFLMTKNADNKITFFSSLAYNNNTQVKKYSHGDNDPQLLTPVNIKNELYDYSLVQYPDYTGHSYFPSLYFVFTYPFSKTWHKEHIIANNNKYYRLVSITSRYVSFTPEPLRFAFEVADPT